MLTETSLEHSLIRNFHPTSLSNQPYITHNLKSGVVASAIQLPLDACSMLDQPQEKGFMNFYLRTLLMVVRGPTKVLWRSENSRQPYLWNFSWGLPQTWFTRRWWRMGDVLTGSSWHEIRLTTVSPFHNFVTLLYSCLLALYGHVVQNVDHVFTRSYIYPPYFVYILSCFFFPDTEDRTCILLTRLSFSN